MLKIFHGKAFLIGQEADDQKLWVKELSKTRGTESGLTYARGVAETSAYKTIFKRRKSRVKFLTFCLFGAG